MTIHSFISCISIAMDEELKCQTCEKKFASKKNLRQHVRHVHEKKKMHECDICNKKFALKTNLRQHVQHVHENQTLHECGICEKKFASKKNLHRHVRRIHEKQTIHECGICEKKFTLKENLRRHVRHVHEKQTIHECGICNKKFARKKNKEMHLRTCSQRFGAGNNLNFIPVLRKSAFGGCFADWKIVFPEDYHRIDLTTLLSASTLAMKEILEKHIREQTQRLKFTMAIHVVFEQPSHPEVKTDPPVVLRTNPYTVYMETKLDMILGDKMAKHLLELIETYEGYGSGWRIDYIKRLDTDIASF